MFGLFETRKKNTCAARLRRLIDRTANWRIPEVELREAERCKRTMPVFMSPWKGKNTTADEIETCISVDISDNGLRVLSLRQSGATGFLVSIINMEDGIPEIYSFVAEVCSDEDFAPGIRSIGLKATQIVDVNDLLPDVRDFLQTRIAEIAIQGITG